MLAKIISYSTRAVKLTSLALRTSKAFKSWSIIALMLSKDKVRVPNR